MDLNIYHLLLASILIILIDRCDGLARVESTDTNHTISTVENSSNFDKPIENVTPKILSRRRRYVAFPDGSSFSVTIFSMLLFNLALCFQAIYCVYLRFNQNQNNQLEINMDFR